MLIKQSMMAKKLAEEMLKQITSYNKAVKEITLLEKVISRNMKEAIRTAQSLQKEPLPPAAQAKINEYKEKYAHIENLGIMVGNLTPYKQMDQIISYDVQ